MSPCRTYSCGNALGHYSAKNTGVAGLTFCKVIGEDKAVASQAILVEPKGLHENGLDISKLTPLTVDDAYDMKRGATKSIKSFIGQKKRDAML